MMYGIYLAAVVLPFSAFCMAGSVSLPPYHARGQLIVPVEQLSFRPYEFGYELGDGLGMTQHRREVADGSGAVKGSYGYMDSIGVTRIVDYKADIDGYKAIIRSNEPGLSGQNSADAVFIVQTPPPAAVAQGLRRRFPRPA